MNNAIRCNEGILSTLDTLVLFYLSYALHTVGVKRKVEVIFFLSSPRALGLLLADGTPTVGGGKTF